MREAKGGDLPTFADGSARISGSFCASLADVFDNRAPAGAREDLFALIAATPDLDWQLLTKRPENIARFVPADWGDGYSNVWLGATAEDQVHFDRRWKSLGAVPAALRFISYEPALGPLRFIGDGPFPDWIISGGESQPSPGVKVRVTNPQWVRDLALDCERLGVALFHKQWGTYGSNPLVIEAGRSPIEAASADPKSNGKGGGLLDGRLYRAFPTSAAPAAFALV